jgi:hypothetical protein
VEFSLLWCNVLFGAGNSLHDDVFRAKSEIGDFNVWNGCPFFVLLGQQDIFWLQIAMSDSMVMQLLHALGNLQYTFESVNFREFVILHLIECIPMLYTFLTRAIRQSNTQ